MDDGVDLNKVGEAANKAAKAAMDVAFEQHALRPGDADYVHDKRVEAKPREELEDNEWDDEIDDFDTDDEFPPIDLGV